MNGDLIIKDVDLEQLEEDLNVLEGLFGDFEYGCAGARVLVMLKTWAESRRADKEDEELAESLTTNLKLNNTEKPIEIKAAILYALKEQRKRLSK